MRISIAMCTYNGEKYLRTQLKSFVSQTHQPHELVVCDDGSTDTTLAIVDEFAQTAEFAVRIFKNERNLGSTKNFEKAITLCEGDLIALSDQDDEWYEDKLARMHQLFENLPKVSAAFSDADVVDENSISTNRRLWESVSFVPSKKAPYSGSEITAALFKLNYIATGATMVLRSDFRRDFMPIPDSWVHDAWISWIAAVRGRLATVPSATIRYRIHTTQQVGLPPPSFVAHLAVATKNQLYFRTLAVRLRGLLGYLEGCQQDDQLMKIIPDLQAKVQHAEGRACLSGNLIQRARWIFQTRKEYLRYSRGLIAMVSDTLIVNRT